MLEERVLFFLAILDVTVFKHQTHLDEELAAAVAEKFVQTDLHLKGRRFQRRVQLLQDTNGRNMDNTPL